MVKIVKTFTNIGLNGYQIDVEVDSNKALPGIQIVGLPDAAINEAKERIKGTFRNIGIKLPNRKIILNLAPSDIKKIGTRFDFPMAVAILMITLEGKLDLSIINESIFFGELGLDGNLKKIDGILPSVISAYKNGYINFFVPIENVSELKYIKGINIYGLNTFGEFVEHILGNVICNKIIGGQNGIDIINNANKNYNVDFKDIKGHLLIKRALMIAAAGMHNVLFIGSPGTGKTMLSKALNSILPPMNFEEILEVSQIYSIVGKLSSSNPLILNRPFRSVHHTASKISIIGGGQHLLPGEISLSHRGILYLDELTEFPRQVLEVLRQPLEDKTITISRANGSVDYPAQFMLVASMNPCKCGYYKDIEKTCVCSINDVKKYQSRISGPLLDRFDMILEVPRENVDCLFDEENTQDSKSILDIVVSSWNIQGSRFKEYGIYCNSQMSSKEINKIVKLDDSAYNILKLATNNLSLSPRVIHRIIKLSRTIADINNEDTVLGKHISEALHYRSKSLLIEL